MMELELEEGGGGGRGEGVELRRDEQKWFFFGFFLHLLSRLGTPNWDIKLGFIPVEPTRTNASS